MARQNNTKGVSQTEMHSLVNNQIDRDIALTREVVQANKLKYDELTIDEKDYFDRSINRPIT